MPARITYTPGEQLGSSGVIFIKDIKTTDRHRKALFLCPQCGKQ